jgi:DNA polymerase III epsilon subunit family exonuclease
MMVKDFVVVDIETTGLSCSKHKITEIAALRVKNHKVKRQFQTLVNPECHIPSFITNLTGIDDEMVEDAPKIEEVLPAFNKFLGKHVFVGHNATFDFNFLDFNTLKMNRIGLNNDLLCTMRLARRILPHLPSKRLCHVCDHLEVNNLQAHRAMGDALATSKVLSHFLKELEKRNIKKITDIIDFQMSRIPKIVCSSH